MNRDHIPYVLYDLSLAIGSEVRLVPLLVKTLQRILFHTGFPVGVVVLDQVSGPDGVCGQLHTVIGDHVLLERQGELVCWSDGLLTGPSGTVEEASQFDCIGGSRRYIHALRFAVGDTGTILLLSEAPLQTKAMFIRILQPVMQNLDRSIRLVRDSEQLTRTLESDLERSRSLLQTVIDTVPVTISWKDRGSRYLGCNPLLAEAAGMDSTSDVIGKTDYDLAWADQAEKFRADDRMVMETGVPQIGYEELVTSTSGQLQWLRIAKVPLRGPDDEVIGVLCTFEDITERKQIEEHLKASEARYRAAFETTLDAIAIHRLEDDLLIDCNSGYVETAGLRREELIGRSSDQSGIWDPEERQRLLHLLKRGGAVRNFEARLIRRSGGMIWGLVSASCVTMDGVPCVITVTRDISEMKLAREELEFHQLELEQRILKRTAELAEAKTTAESASAAKTSFLANMSHEIRTPLNVITGMANLIRRGGLSPEQTGRMDKLLGASQHLLAILGTILDLSKIEAGKMVLESSPLSVETVVETTVSMMRERAEERGLRLMMRIDPLTADLHGDSGKLQQALLNLVSNAIKFTRQGSVLILVRLVESSEERAVLSFEVTDTGPGIDPEMLPRLTQAFEQADNSSTRAHGGTGLGLTITRNLAELMGGELGASSVPGVGSTFWFTAVLDRVKATVNDDLCQSGVAEQVIAGKHAGRPVLVVDDDPANREITSLMLMAVGLKVEVACDGCEALEAAGRSDYALVIMDVQMPRMDGLEATRQLRLRSDWAGVPVVALTAGAFAEDRVNCLAAGMDDFITKPITPDCLYRTVLNWLDRSPTADRQSKGS